jgi:prepilin-type processing-associated H-X9-DG protein
LVELLVVIGIIGVLVSILLPALSRVRQGANTAVCAAQLRAHMQGLLLYASEHKGSMPWGFAWETSVPGLVYAPANFKVSLQTPWRVSMPMAPAYQWWTVLADQAVKGSTSQGTWISADFNQSLSYSELAPKLGKSFVCPDVASISGYEGVINCYAANSIVLPNQAYETAPKQSGLWRYGGSPQTAFSQMRPTLTSIAPAKSGQLYPDTAVLWDTPAFADLPGTINLINFVGGPTISGVDGGALTQPTVAWMRYRDFGYVRVAPEELLENPIFIPGPNVKINGVNFAFANADGLSGFVYPYQYGTPRFRHNGNRLCNVAFADGSVRALGIREKQVAYTDSFGRQSLQSEFLRRYIQIKLPASLPSPQATP